MGVRTVQTKATTPYERGQEFGQRCAAQIEQTWQHYVALWGAFAVTAGETRSVGEAVLGPLEDYSADLSTELLGMSEGCGLQPWQLGALNARTELLALGDQRLLEQGRLPGEVTECSTLVQLPPDRAPLTAQTWDWHTPLQDSWCVWTLRLADARPNGQRSGQSDGQSDGQPDGRVVRTLTEYGILGKIGVASLDRPGQPRTGLLGLHFNALRHTADTGVGGVPVHLVARRLLNEARTLDEAQALARAAHCTASAALTVTARRWTDGPWAACTVELHPAGPSVLDQSGEQSDGVDGGRWLAHTNHFLADQVPASAERASTQSTTRERLDRVATIARHPAGVARVDPQAIVKQLATHDLGSRSVCVHEEPDAAVGQRAATLAVAVAQPEAGRLHVHAGKPCQAQPDTWWTG